MPKILAIDDKQDNLTTISALLKSFIPDCVVITAQSGTEGIEKARSESPDTILLDIIMPGMNGFEVCRVLKSEERTEHIPIVMLTAIKTDAESRVKGFELGADAFLSKPIDETELASQIKVMLRIKKAEDQLRKEKDLLEDTVRERTRALRESEERFRGFSTASSYGFAIGELTGSIIYGNSAFANMIEVDNTEDVIGINFYDLVTEEGKNEFIETITPIVMKTGRYVGERTLVTVQGMQVTTEQNIFLIYDNNGEPAYFANIITDITERKQMEEALRESEKKYRQLFYSERDAIMVFDAETMLFEEANRACLDLYGYAKDEFFRLTPKDISAQHEETGKALKDIINEKGSERIPLRYQKRKDGTVFPVEITSGTFEIKGHKKIIGAIRDISERIEADQKRKTLEAQLQQAQKLESIGTLAGGIAHDFNNILSPIMIHSEMVMEELPDDSPMQFNLKEIFKAGERARDLVKQILTFSRKGKGEQATIKITPILKEVLKMLRSSIPTTIDIHQDLEAESDIILADPTQIHQILLNLGTNAAHAMRDKGGTLKVSLIQEDLDSEATKQYSDLNPGSHLKLTISDTGSGIDDETMERIFEPYFTTKGPGEGTGMGLALVHGIVKSYGGDITVESEVGKGTTFNVLLPKIEADVSPVEDHEAALPRGTERILFVDDEKGAVDAIQPMLENLGYQVTARTSSIEALEAFRNNPEGFDLVITDMTMPNMTGKDLAKELMSIRSDIPIILCTGFSEQIDEYKAKEMSISAYVMKPIVRREIANTIREVLDKK